MHVAGLLALAVLMVAAPARAEDSLYHDLGEKNGIGKIAEYFVADILADIRVKGSFDNTNMERFQKLFVDHICEVSGGPCEYKGRSMKDAHKALGLGNGDFNAIVEDLQAAMDKAGVSFPTQNRLLARLAPMQHDIVTK